MKKLAISLLLLAGVSTAFAGGDPVAGKAKATLCFGCHGADGNSSNPDWPSLAAQGAPYIAKQVADFKSGARKDPTMSAMAAQLQDADLDDVAAYFASNKRNLAGADKDKVAMGEKIYRAGIADKGVAACASCHGPTGIGNPAAKFPALSGQHAKYTTKALNDFRSGARSNDPQKMMQTVAAKLSDKEIDAVASYVAGLH